MNIQLLGRAAFLRTIIGVSALIILGSFQTAHAGVSFISTNDCGFVQLGSRIGAWDSGSNTCIINQNYTIPSGVTLENGFGVSLRVRAGFTLTVASGATLTNVNYTEVEGELENLGSISNSGTIKYLFPGGMYSGNGTLSSSGPVAISGSISSSAVDISRFGPSSTNYRVLDTLVIENGSSLTINGNYRLINEGTIDNFGSFNVLASGYVRNFALFNNDTTFNNAGEVTNEVGGTIDGKGIVNSSVLVNFGTINHSGTVINSGALHNGEYRGEEELTAIYNLTASGVLTNNGQFYNSATFNLTNLNAELQNNSSATNEFGGNIEANNGGAIYNNASSTFTGNGDFNLINGAISVKSGSTFSIGGKLTITGSSLLNIDSGGVFDNFGEIESVVRGRIQNGGTLNNKRFGVINNEGTILSDSGGTINNENGATFRNRNNGDVDNSATFINAGTLANFYGEFNNNLGSSLTNTGIISNTGFPFAPLDGNFRNYGTLTNEASGSIENNDSIFNYGVLGNSGSLTNNDMMDNYAAAAINNTGTLTNNGVINAYCGGTVSGPIDVNPALSNCDISEAVVLSDEASCGELGGAWDTGTNRCSIGSLVTDKDLTIENNAQLHISGVLQMNDASKLTLASGMIRSTASGVINLASNSAQFCDGADDKLEISTNGILINDGEINVCRCSFGCKIDNYGEIKNGGVINLDGEIWNFGTLDNTGDVFMGGADSVGQSGRSVLKNWSPLGVIESSGYIESYGFIDNDEATINNHGVIDNYYHITNGFLTCGNDDFNQPYTCFFNNFGEINNYDLIFTQIKSSFILEEGSTLINKAGSQLKNNGYFGLRKDATLFQETGSFFENLGDAIVELGENAVVWVEGAVESFGTWLSGAASTVANLFDLSFHNYGTYINSGVLDNGDETGETAGFFENLGTFQNSGTITNRNGRFANGADPNSASALSLSVPNGNAGATAVLTNTGSITVDSGRLDNYAEIRSFTGSTITGSVSGAPATSVDNSPPVASSSSNADGKYIIQLVATDDDGDDLTYRVMGAGSAHGIVEIEGNMATYTPTSGFQGLDQFFFVANDGQVDSNLGTVKINDAIFSNGFEQQR